MKAYVPQHALIAGDYIFALYKPDCSMKIADEYLNVVHIYPFDFSYYDRLWTTLNIWPHEDFMPEHYSYITSNTYSFHDSDAQIIYKIPKTRAIALTHFKYLIKKAYNIVLLRDVLLFNGLNDDIYNIIAVMLFDICIYDFKKYKINLSLL